MMRFGYRQSQGDHTLFIKNKLKGKLTTLFVYVDDIILTRNDVEEMKMIKLKLAKEFKIKDLDSLRFFFGIEVARSKKGIYVSQQKDILDLLNEVGMLGCKPKTTPINPIIS